MNSGRNRKFYTSGAGIKAWKAEIETEKGLRT
jgi:hypothetical protein